MEAKTITLDRTGQAPLRFEGELLAESDGRIAAGRDHNRWHAIRIFRTAGGAYVVAVGYRTQWRGELDHDWVEAREAPADLADALRYYDPEGHVLGYPPGEQYAEKQAWLRADLRTRYEHQVSAILGSHPEFAEVIT